MATLYGYVRRIWLRKHQAYQVMILHQVLVGVGLRIGPIGLYRFLRGDYNLGLCRVLILAMGFCFSLRRITTFCSFKNGSSSDDGSSSHS